ncbi:MAG TPA: hypothetical protein VGR26_06550 [Acidimicrobiales bacterium]|nr:hypothetical protein [Acidimicrobiales bacterium]
MGADEAAEAAGGTQSEQDEATRERVFSLLKKLDLIGLPEADAQAAGAPGVIQSTSLEITQQAKKLITGLGGTTVIIGAATSAWAALEDNVPLAIAVAAGIAVVLSALVLGLAKIVDGDVRGRAAVTADQISTRGAVANKLLELTLTEPKSEPTTPGSTRPAKDQLWAALSASSGGLEVSTEGGLSEANGLQWSEKNGLRIKLENGNLVSPSEVTSLSTASGRSKLEAAPTIQDELRVALAGWGGDVVVSTEGGLNTVSGLEWSEKRGLRIKLENGDIIDPTEVTSFKASRTSS